MEFDAIQEQAIERCIDVKRPIAAVTGQAGTGKTSIMRRIHDLFVQSGYRVALAAPTGKAAKRITEATGIEASTIHRLLQYPKPREKDPKTGRPYRSGWPRRHRGNPLEYDVVLVDEYSMVANQEHRNLIDAMPDGSLIRMFGDANQLQPVERSKMLRKMDTPFVAMLKKFDGVRLETVHRNSSIAANAQRILKGRIPARTEDFHLHITERPVDRLRNLVLEHYTDSGVDYSTLDHQIITPANISWVGTHRLNAMLQSVYRPERDGWLELPRHEYDEKFPIRVRAGDKIIWTENNYDIMSTDETTGLFNGEVGIVTEVDQVFGTVTVDFGDRFIVIPPEMEGENPYNRQVYFYDPRKSIQLAYALTTHKSQGSEFLSVIYVLNKSTRMQQSRANAYTAVTRAKQVVHVISDQRSLSYSVSHVEK